MQKCRWITSRAANKFKWLYKPQWIYKKRKQKKENREWIFFSFLFLDKSVPRDIPATHKHVYSREWRSCSLIRGYSVIDWKYKYLLSISSIVCSCCYTTRLQCTLFKIHEVHRLKCDFTKSVCASARIQYLNTLQYYFGHHVVKFQSFL